MQVGTEDTRAAIAALCDAAIERSNVWQAKIENRKAAEASASIARAARIQTRRVGIGSQRLPWDAIRALPEVAAFIAQGFKLVEVTADNGRRTAVLERPIERAAVIEV